MPRDRTTFIGGSDIAAIVGLHPYKTALRVWAEKCGIIQAPDISNEDAVYWGNQLENLVGKEWGRRAGGIAIRKTVPPRRIGSDFKRGEIDFWTSSDHASAFLECKTAGVSQSQRWGPTGSDDYPVEYFLQCQWYMSLIDGAEECALAVLIGGRDFRHYEIRRDDDVCLALHEKADAFWAHVLKETPPPLTSVAVDETAALREIYPSASEPPVLTSEEVTEAAEQYNIARDREKAAKEAKAGAASVLMAHMGESDQIIDEAANVIATWRSHERRDFDLTSFKQDYPEIFEAYRVARPVRTIRVPKPKEDQL